MSGSMKGYPQWEDHPGLGDNPWRATCLKITSGADPATALAWLDTFVQGQVEHVILYDFERKRLEASLGKSGSGRVVLLLDETALDALLTQVPVKAAAGAPAFEVKILHYGKAFETPDKAPGEQNGEEAPEPEAEEGAGEGMAPAPVVKETDPAEQEPGPQPIVGIIDDGIAFLNARFCKLDGQDKKTLKTRFQAVWLQSAPNFTSTYGDGAGGAHLSQQLQFTLRRHPTSPPAREWNLAPFRAEAAVPIWSEFSARFPGKFLDTMLGPKPYTLTGDEIDGFLADPRSEAEIYGDINSWLYPVTGQPSTNATAAHGTHVLDLAAGAEPDTKDRPPLLAVQLAPAMLHDTSGRRLESFLVMGLRWLVSQALEAAEKRDLVVNLSLGSLGGSGDPSNFIADSIAAEIVDYEAQSGKRMSVVLAYGNSWRSDLVAEMPLTPGTSRTLDWRILPEDCASSYLEIRLPKAGKGTNLTLTPPGGEPLTWAWGGDPLYLGQASGTKPARAAILPMEPEGDILPVLLTVAPTARPLEGPASAYPLAMPGAWQVTLETEAKGLTASFRVQRSDTPVGYRVLGRQSYLADPEAETDWDRTTRDYTQPGSSLVDRRGTANAYTGLKDAAEGGKAVFYIGAAAAKRDAAEDPQNPVFKPALYTSEGNVSVWADNCDRKGLQVPGDPSNRKPAIAAQNIDSPGPTFSVLVEEGRFLPGQRGASVISGARGLWLSGTSQAAGLATRLVAESMAQAQGVQALIDDLKGGDDTPTRDSRLGLKVKEVPAPEPVPLA